MAFIDNYDFDDLKNEAERLLEEELGRQLEARPGDTCLCEECVMDMAAYALNMVKPLYRHSLLGSQYAAQAMKDPAYAKTIREAVTTAIEKVRKNPAHD
jgi:competence protein ComFB